MTITRRLFLAGSAASALGALSTKDSFAAEGLDWAALTKRVGGAVIRPGDKRYADFSHGYNTLLSAKPAGVVEVVNARDVAECVRAAAASGTRIAARSGGHSYGGFSTPSGGLVVDLRKLSTIRVAGDGTATIGAGAKLADVYKTLASKGRALGAGSCGSVGIGGLTLGGGVGVLSAKLGLTCDQLLSARVVTADGKALTASAKSEPDLFWALRGGGGGNFGIVTDFTFRTVPAPTLTVFSVTVPAGHAAAALRGWQRWLPQAPRELWTNFHLTGSTATIVGCFYGPQGPAAAAVTKMLTVIGMNSAPRTLHQKDYLAAMRWFSGADGRQGFHASSRVVTKAIDAQRVVDIARTAPTIALIFDSLGGAVSAVRRADSAFPHRGALASVQIYGAATASNSTAIRNSVTAIRDKLGALTGQTAYVNYLDASMPHWANAYYGANLDRLRRVAHHYDPKAVFRFAQGLDT